MKVDLYWPHLDVRFRRSMSRFGIEVSVRRRSASLTPSSLYKRAWTVPSADREEGHQCPTNQPLSGECEGSRDARGYRLWKPRRSPEHEPYTLVDAASHGCMYHYTGVSLAEIEAFLEAR
jgi:hypothetical protein